MDTESLLRGILVLATYRGFGLVAVGLKFGGLALGCVVAGFGA